MRFSPYKWKREKPSECRFSLRNHFMRWFTRSASLLLFVYWTIHSSKDRGPFVFLFPFFSTQFYNFINKLSDLPYVFFAIGIYGNSYATDGPYWCDMPVHIWRRIYRDVVVVLFVPNDVQRRNARKWNRKLFDFYWKLENLRDVFDLCSSRVNIWIKLSAPTHSIDKGEDGGGFCVHKSMRSSEPTYVDIVHDFSLSIKWC